MQRQMLKCGQALKVFQPGVRHLCAVEQPLYIRSIPRGVPTIVRDLRATQGEALECGQSFELPGADVCHMRTVRAKD